MNKFILLLILAGCSKPDAPTQIRVELVQPLTIVKEVAYCEHQMHARMIIRELNKIKTTVQNLDKYSVEDHRKSFLQVHYLDKLDISIQELHDINQVMTQLKTTAHQLRWCTYQSQYWEDKSCKEFDTSIKEATFSVENLPCNKQVD